MILCYIVFLISFSQILWNCNCNYKTSHLSRKCKINA